VITVAASLPAYRRFQLDAAVDEDGPGEQGHDHDHPDERKEHTEPAPLAVLHGEGLRGWASR
jgi:hypothetical protein